MTNPAQTKPVHEETTYQMLVESEEKERGLMETFIYLLLVLATVSAIWQFGHQPITLAAVGAADPQKIVAFM